MTAMAFATFLNRLAASVLSLRAAKGDSTGLVLRRMPPVLLREPVKGCHPLPVPLQHYKDCSSVCTAHAVEWVGVI
jgi:hypothetical protein